MTIEPRSGFQQADQRLEEDRLTGTRERPGRTEISPRRKGEGDIAPDVLAAEGFRQPFDLYRDAHEWPAPSAPAAGAGFPPPSHRRAPAVCDARVRPHPDRHMPLLLTSNDHARHRLRASRSFRDPDLQQQHSRAGGGAKPDVTREEYAARAAPPKENGPCCWCVPGVTPGEGFALEGPRAPPLASSRRDPAGSPEAARST